MSDEVLDSYIRQYIQSQPVPQINFAWQGGEPTLLGGITSERSSRFKRNMLTASGSATRSRPTARCSTTNGAQFLAENQISSSA